MKLDRFLRRPIFEQPRCLVVLNFSIFLLFVLFSSPPVAIGQDSPDGEDQPAEPPLFSNVPEWADRSAGLSGFWDVYFRTGDGNVVRRVHRLNHHQRKNKPGKIVWKDGIKGRSFDEDTTDGIPGIDLFEGSLGMLNHKNAFQVNGRELKLKETYSTYNGTFRGQFRVRNWREIRGELSVDPHWVEAKKGDFKTKKKRSFRVYLRRRLPEIHRVRPRVITMDDIVTIDHNFRVNLYGRLLPIGRVLGETNLFRDVRIEEPGLELKGGTHIENHIGTGYSMKLAGKKNLSNGPKSVFVMGKRFDDVFHVVESSKRIFFQRHSGEERINSAGFWEPFYVWLKFDPETTPETDSFEGTMTLEPGETFDREDSGNARYGEEVSLQFVRSRDGDHLYRSNKLVVFTGGFWDAFPDNDSITSEYPELTHHRFSGQQNDYLKVTYRNNTSTMVLYDPCYEIKKQIDRVESRLEEIRRLMKPLSVITGALLKRKKKWLPVYHRKKNPLEDLETIEAEMKEQNQYGESRNLIPSVLHTVDRYRQRTGPDSAFQKQLREEVKKRKQEVKKALFPLGEPLSADTVSDQELRSRKEIVESESFQKALKRIPDDLFPDLPISISREELEIIPVDVSKVVNLESFRYPERRHKKRILEELNQSGPQEETVKRIEFLPDKKKILIYSRLTRNDMLRLWKLEDDLSADKTFVASVSTVTHAYEVATLLRRYREIRESFSAIAYPDHLNYANLVIQLLNGALRQHMTLRKDLLLERRAKKEELNRLFERYLNCLQDRGKGGEWVSAFTGMRGAVTRQLNELETYVNETGDRVDDGLGILRENFSQWRDRIRKMYRQMEEAQDTLSVPGEKMWTAAITGLDVALMVWSVYDLARGGWKGARKGGESLQKTWNDYWRQAPDKNDLSKLARKKLNKKASKNVDPEELAAKMREHNLTRAEAHDLFNRMNNGSSFDEALQDVRESRNWVSPDRMKESLKRAGMKESDVKKLIERVGREGMSEQQLENFRDVVRRYKNGNKATKEAVTEQELKNLRSSIERLQEKFDVNLPILSVGSGTEVDKLWKGNLDVSEMENWSFLDNDWDGSFFFHPEAGVQQQQIDEILKKVPEEEATSLQKELQFPESLDKVRKKYRTLKKSNRPGDRAMAERMEEQIHRMKKTIAQRKLEKEFHEIFTDTAGYPPTAPDFNLFSDNPISRLENPEDIRKALQGKTNLLRYVEKGPDGMFFTPGGKKYIELMRASDRPIWLKSGKKAENLKPDRRRALISEGTMTPADGADLTMEMNAFFRQNLLNKYEVSPAEIRKARRKTPSSIPNKLRQKLANALEKTSKYYIRAALGKLASNEEIGENLPKLFSKYSGSPEERILSIASDHTGKNKVFNKSEYLRLEHALNLKKGKRAPGDPATTLHMMRKDLKRWYHGTEEASKKYYDRRMDRILKESDPEKRKQLLRAMDDEMQYHKLARELTQSRLTPDQLEETLGLHPDDARRIGRYATNPNVSRITRGNPLDKLDQDSAVGALNAAKLTRKSLNDLGDGEGGGVLDTIAFPAHWRSKLGELRNEHGLISPEYLTNVLVNSVTSPFESLARAAFMVWEWIFVNTEAHQDFASRIGTYPILFKEVCKEIGRTATRLRHEVVSRNDAPTTTLDGVETFVERFRDRLYAPKATGPGKNDRLVKQIRRLFKKWYLNTYKPKIDRLRADLPNFRARMKAVDKLLDGLATRKRTPVRQPVVVQGQVKMGPLPKTWHKMAGKMRPFIVNQATYLEDSYLKSPKVLFPLGLFHRITSGYLKRLESISGQVK